MPRWPASCLGAIAASWRATSASYLVSARSSGGSSRCVPASNCWAGFAVRFLLLTVFPAGFVAMVPVEAVRDGDPVKVAACAAAAVVYAGLAWLVFERGLRHYTSGSRIIELR